MSPCRKQACVATVFCVAVLASCSGSDSGATLPTLEPSTVTAASSPMPSVEHEASAPPTPAQSSIPTSSIGTGLTSEHIDESISMLFTQGGYSDGRIMLAEHGEIRELTDGSSAAFVPTASRDGTWIAFAGTRGVAVVARDSGESVLVPSSRGCLPGDWFPDNQRFLVNCDGQLGIASRDAIIESDIALVPPGDRPTLSPDGTLLAVGGSGADPRSSIEIRELSGHVVTVLEHTGGQVFGFPRWSPDGRSLVFATHNDVVEVRTISIDGGTPHVVASSPSDDTWADWSGDGTRIVFGGTSDLPGGLYVVDADGANAHPLVEGYPLGDVFWINERQEPSTATGATVSHIEHIDPQAQLTQTVETGFDPPFMLQIPDDWTAVLRDASAFQAYADQENFEITFDHTYREQESVDQGIARLADTAGLVPGPVTAVVVGGRQGKGFLGTASSPVRFLDSGFHTNHAIPVELFVIPTSDGTTITIFLTAEGDPQHGLGTLSPLARRIFETVEWMSEAP